MTDLRQTKEYADYMQLLGWEVINLSGVYCYSKRIPILGHYLKLQRPGKLTPIKYLEDLRNKKRIYAISIEPLNNRQYEYYKKAGLKQSKSTSLPSKTIQIDLNESLGKILEKMHSKTRYNIGLSERRGVRVIPSKNINLFVDFWHASAKRRRFYLPLKIEIESLYKAFGNKAHLLFAYYKTELVSAVFLADSRDTTNYMYAASTPLGNKHFAPSLLVWESVKLAKKLKLKIFDFGGIYDERFPLKSWKGFTRFKESFGGKEVIFPGMLQKFFFLNKEITF